MTLLELLVSLGLTALIMAAVPTVIRITNQALSTTESLDREAADRAAIDLISRHLTQALSMYERGRDGRLQVMFRGEPKLIRFIAPATLGPAGGMFQFEVKAAGGTAEAADPTARGVLFGWQLYRPLTAEDKAAQDWHERLLFPDATDFALSYHGPSQARAEPEWSPSWSATDAIPDLVEIRITTRRAGSSQTRSIRIPLMLKPSR